MASTFRNTRPSDPHIHRKSSDNYSATIQQILSAAGHLRLADPRGPDDLGELPQGETSAQRVIQPAERGGEPPAASQPDPLLQERERLRKSVPSRAQLGKANRKRRERRGGGGTVWQGGQVNSLTWDTASRAVRMPASSRAMSSTSGSDSTSWGGLGQVRL
jgi:hypothetical protein